ncbi:MAG: PP2C family serine/threonine-protein phosphatase [Candidatus Binatia bacterium]
MDRIALYARSDIGLVRTNNEDSYFTDVERGLAIVADGMGGHAAGEVASKITVDTMSECVKAPNSFWPFGRATRERECIVQAIRLANRRVREAAAQDTALAGMGTTVVALWIRGRRAHVAHVGDSRMYRYRKGGLVQLTRDHSWTSEESAMRNVLTRAVGAEDGVEVDHRVLEVANGDVFLLCSDGLTRPVPDETIVSTLSEFRSGEEASERLIDLAKHNGAPDNVTVVLAYC